MPESITDRSLNIATGTGRKTKRWKNQSMRWSELLKRLKKFVVTKEKAAQDRAGSPERQAELEAQLAEAK